MTLGITACMLACTLIYRCCILLAIVGSGAELRQFTNETSLLTQGVSAELQPRLAAAVAHAAGRYGHVMFPENAHQPALDVAAKLLAGVGAGWASRAFFSDDGWVRQVSGISAETAYARFSDHDCRID